MSYKVTSCVLEHSRSTLAARLVLLALAEYAHDDGSNSFPSVKTLARKARVAERTARYALRALEELGEIEKQGVHESGTTIWRVRVEAISAGGADSAPGRSEQEGGQTTAENAPKSAPEPSVEPSEEPAPHPPASGGRKKGDAPPDRPSSQRKRDQAAHLEECGRYAAEHFPHLGDAGAMAVSQAVGAGARSLADVRKFVDRWWGQVA